MRARLISLSGVASIDLVKDVSLVGRSEDCDIRYDHKGVSKIHCVLVKTDGLILVRDLGSTNGTRVNGQRVRRAALLPNDTFAIANLKFKVLFGVELEKEGDPLANGANQPSTPIHRNILPDVYPNPKTPQE